jgi:hypothetical protein
MFGSNHQTADTEPLTQLNSCKSVEMIVLKAKPNSPSVAAVLCF